MNWTEDVVTKMRDMAHQGFSAAQTADRLTAHTGANRAISRSAVISAGHSRGIHFKSRNVLPTSALNVKPLTRSQIPNAGNIVRKSTNCARLPEPSAQPAEMLLISLFDLKLGHCRWPATEPTDDDPVLFCGCSKAGNGVYCRDHAALAYTKRTT